MADTSARTASGKPTVLIVEDEALLRMTAVDFAEEAGFDTVEAGGADEAIRILESRRDIRIVFTDVDMPGGMDGIKLAALVRDRWPPIELIITSGKCTPRPEEMPERGVFYPKPYRADEVVAQMRRMVG